MNEYEKQANDFLLATNISIFISKAEPQTSPLWAKKGEKHGIDYQVRLKNDKACYDFHFWDSIANKESKKKPNNYDILACLSPLYEDNFEDFADNFGYVRDSLIGFNTFNACKEQDRMLRKLFNDSQLELLAEIQ